jgi:hypothetical protein
VTQQWYRDFCSDENLPNDLLAEVLAAANYLSISPLLDLACLKYTFQLMGKNADEVSSASVSTRCPFVILGSHRPTLG